MARLNAVLTRDEFYCPQAVAIIRLPMLTGCRVGEIVSLEQDWIRGKREAAWPFPTAGRLTSSGIPGVFRAAGIRHGLPPVLTGVLGRLVMFSSQTGLRQP